MSASNLLTRLVKDADIRLKDKGFARSRHKFSISRDGNVGLIEFQKSRKSSPDRVVFTINVGVWSARVAKFLPSSAKSEPPDADDCHWHQRIGFLLPARLDKWWMLENEVDLDYVRAEIIPLLDRLAVPTVIAHLGDADLRDEWLTGNAPSLTSIQRLLYLTILLKEIGPGNCIAEIVSELRREAEGKPAEAIVLQHLQRLGIDDRQAVAG